jgi:hypothetical protein
MLSWRVSGTEKDTGKEIIVTLQATTIEEASEAARQSGISVTSVQRQSPAELSTDEKIESHLRVIRGWVTFIGIVFLVGLILSILIVFFR